MRNLWELTPEEAAEQAGLSASDTREADELVAPIMAEQMFLLEASEAEIAAVLPPDEAAYVLVLS